jgi:3-hydroxymyristoyl/3-hydroxydecanoyl-(acyl carrier protein) dehydratase
MAAIHHPEIVHESSDACRVQLRIRLPHDLEFFAGHFPRSPILPGVVQVHWAIELAQRYFGKTGAFAGLTNLKFNRPMLPGAELELELCFDSQQRWIDYSYSDVSEKYASGRVLFNSAP